MYEGNSSIGSHERRDVGLCALFLRARLLRKVAGSSPTESVGYKEIRLGGFASCLECVRAYRATRDSSRDWRRGSGQERVLRNSLCIDRFGLATLPQIASAMSDVRVAALAQTRRMLLRISLSGHSPTSLTPAIGSTVEFRANRVHVASPAVDVVAHRRRHR